MDSRADELDKRMAVTLCQILDCIELKGDFVGKVTLDQIKDWIQSCAASHIAARKVAVIESKRFRNYWN
jgi:hypothetical protein